MILKLNIKTCLTCLINISYLFCSCLLFILFISGSYFLLSQYLFVDHLNCPSYTAHINNINYYIMDLYEYASLNLTVHNNKCLKLYSLYILNVTATDKYEAGQNIKIYYKCATNILPFDLECSENDDYSLVPNYYILNSVQKTKLLIFILVFAIFLTIISLSCCIIILIINMVCYRSKNIIKNKIGEEIGLLDSVIDEDYSIDL